MSRYTCAALLALTLSLSTFATGALAASTWDGSGFPPETNNLWDGRGFPTESSYWDGNGFPTESSYWDGNGFPTESSN